MVTWRVYDVDGIIDKEIDKLYGVACYVNDDLNEVAQNICVAQLSLAIGPTVRVSLLCATTDIQLLTDFFFQLNISWHEFSMLLIFLEFTCLAMFWDTSSYLGTGSAPDDVGDIEG